MSLFNVSVKADIHVHTANESEILAKLDGLTDLIESVQSHLFGLKTQVELLRKQTMAKFSDVDEAINAVNDATNALAARVDEAITELQQEGGTTEQRDAALAKLVSVKNALEAIASDSDNPIPE